MASKVTTIAKMNNPSKAATDAIIKQKLDSTDENNQLIQVPLKLEKKMAYGKDKSGNTVGPKGNKIGRPKKKEIKEQISFSISKETKDRLMEYLSKNDELSISSVCAMAIKEFLKNHS